MSDDPTRTPSETEPENDLPETAERLLPLVYQELRELAMQRLAREVPGQTLQATALVHEAYLRLLGSDPGRDWYGRRHFFKAASEAMRRILVETARRKKRLRHGGDRQRVEFCEDQIAVSVESPLEDLVAFDEALEALTAVDPAAAELVKLRRFSGLTTEEAAAVLGISNRAAYRTWAFARAWLFRRLNPGEEPQSPYRQG